MTVLLIEEAEFLACHLAEDADQAPWVMAADQGFAHLVPGAVEVVGVD